VSAKSEKILPTGKKKLKPRTRKSKNQKTASSPPLPLQHYEDPWKKIRSPYGGRLSQAECLKKIQSIAHQASYIHVFDENKVKSTGKWKGEISTGLSEELLQAIELSCCDLKPPNADDQGLYLRVSEANLKVINFGDNDMLAARIVWLDASKNQIQSCKGLGGPNCYIRSLNISGNQLASLSEVSPMAHLVELDVSGNSLLPDLDLKFCSNSLRVFRANNCNLSSSSIAGIQCCTELEAVYLANNRISEADSVRGVLAPTMRKHLRILHMANNPLSEEEWANLTCWLRQQCPCLTEIDGIAQEQEFKHTLNIEDLNLNATESIMVQDKASCSCLEGNPCAVEYNCKDWANRFEVAKHVRAELGYQTTK